MTAKNVVCYTVMFRFIDHSVQSQIQEETAVKHLVCANSNKARLGSEYP